MPGSEFLILMSVMNATELQISSAANLRSVRFLLLKDTEDPGWLCTPTVLALGMQEQADQEFKMQTTKYTGLVEGLCMLLTS